MNNSIRDVMGISQAEKRIVDKINESELPRLDMMVAAMGLSKTVNYFQRQFEYQQSGQREIYIATVDGNDAGYCILNWDPKYALFRKLGIPEIQDLNVLPHFRRQGLATDIIEHCEARALEEGRDSMGIGVSVSPDFGPAQRLYARLGYIPDGNGATYDRKQTAGGEVRPLDGQLCLMMVKELGKDVVQG